MSKRSIWENHYSASARSKINDSYEDYAIIKRGSSLSPNLTMCDSLWYYREGQSLQCAYLIGGLLDMRKAGDLNDFGTIRAIRGMYVAIPIQVFLSAEEFKAFLYHHIFW